MKGKVILICTILATMVITMALQAHEVKGAESLIWTASVYSSGQAVTSPILMSGIQYRIVAKEIFFYLYSPMGSLAADAQYYTTSWSGWIWNNYYAPDGHSFLQINGNDVNWGPFSNGDTGHTYSIYYTGNNAAITFQLIDWLDGNYTNNYCHLPVFIYKTDIPPPPLEAGHSPGYWKHQFNAYYEGKGNPQEAWGDLESYTGKINAYYGSTPPYFEGYPLPPVSSFDHNNDGAFGTEDAHYMFTDSEHHTLWLGLANWYNWASGLGPYS